MPKSAKRPANTDTQAGAPPSSASSARHLLAGEDGRHVDLDAVARQRAHHVEQRLTARGGHRQLDVDILAPGGDDAGLRDHFRNVVGEHLKRDVAVGYGGDEIAGIAFVVAHPGFLEQRGVGGEPGNPGLLGHLDDLRLVGAVGEQLDFEIGQFRHACHLFEFLFIPFSSQHNQAMSIANHQIVHFSVVPTICLRQ